MAKKIVKQAPHLRVRLDPKLVARLEKARETNGKTLTGEIVDRLEGTFATDDAIDLVRRMKEDQIASLEKRNADLTQQLELAREQREKDTVNFHHSLEVHRSQNQAIELAGTVLDALLGEDAASKEAIRAVALVLANDPDWASTADNLQKITDSVVAAIKAAAEKGAKQ